MKFRINIRESIVFKNNNKKAPILITSAIQVESNNTYEKSKNIEEEVLLGHSTEVKTKELEMMRKILLSIGIIILIYINC